MAQNLKAAMAMEKVYRKLQNNWQAKTAFDYHDKLKRFGFADTVEYERAKDLYFLKNSDIPVEYIDVTELYIKRRDAIDNCSEVCHIVTASNNTVIRGLQSEYNETYCSDNNIFVFEHPASGVLVTTPDDLIVSIVCKRHGLEQYLLELIRDTLVKFGIDCYIDGNDILYQDKKLLGFASMEFGCVSVYAFQISFVVDLELIQTICYKPMVKQPMGISEVSRITRDQVISRIVQWLQ